MGMVYEETERGVPIELPRTFGKYTYVRTLGAASTSVVLLVQDRSGEQYAAKVVKRESLADAGMEYFEREVRLLQYITHPNIVHLHETVFLPQYIILIMEFCEHGDLFDYIAQHGPLPIPQLRTFSFQLLRALQCLHEKGFAHRDLKPENILVCSDVCVKLADFGLARGVPVHGMMQTLCGSLHYMAPEVIEEIPYDGCKSDVWSFGIILFAMAFNQLPWRSQEAAGVAKEIVHAEISMPKSIAIEVWDVIRICTRIRPEDRPKVTDILDVPWLAEEEGVYNRRFGLTAGLSMRDIRASNCKSAPRFVGSAKSCAKLVLAKPSHKSVVCDKLRRRSTIDTPDPLS